MVQPFSLLIRDTQRQERRGNMEKGYIAGTRGIKAWDKIGYAMGDLASCLVILLLRFVYPLSRQKIGALQLEKEKVLGAAR